MSKALEKHASDCFANHISPMMKQIEEVKKEVTDIKVSIAGLPKDLADEFDRRYASKETEESLKRIMWIVIVAVITAVLALVVRK